MAEVTGGGSFPSPFKNQIVMGGFDRIHDAVGNDRSIRDALRRARSEGSVVFAAITLAPRRLDDSPVWFREVELPGVNGQGREVFGGRETKSFEIAPGLYRQGLLDLSGFVTPVFPMGEHPRAVHAFLNKGGIQTPLATSRQVFFHRRVFCRSANSS